MLICVYWRSHCNLCTNSVTLFFNAPRNDMFEGSTDCLSPFSALCMTTRHKSKLSQSLWPTSVSDGESDEKKFSLNVGHQISLSLPFLSWPTDNVGMGAIENRWDWLSICKFSGCLLSGTILDLLYSSLLSLAPIRWTI